ncbi:MAG: cytochrome C [Deltaproteobacteria bacterium]|nr:cytochrome C [Candidatus Anaeroferrophillus wilburensis]MBN2888016.1 cytochrome C [Deltaproteobacteria bacterium]
MKNVWIVMVVCCLWLVVAAAVQADGKGPEQMDLKARFQVEGSKKAVIFPHHQHQAKLACTKCHPSDAGGPLVVTIENKSGTANDFHKKFCWPCHVEMQVPKGKMCMTCHK